MENEKYTPCPTDKIHHVNYTESAVDCLGTPSSATEEFDWQNRKDLQ